MNDIPLRGRIALFGVLKDMYQERAELDVRILEAMQALLDAEIAKEQREAGQREMPQDGVCTVTFKGPK